MIETNHPRKGCRIGYERGFIPPEPPGKYHDRERMKSRTAWIAGAVLLLAAAIWFAIAVFLAT